MIYEKLFNLIRISRGKRMKRNLNACLLFLLLLFSSALYAGKPDDFYKMAKKSLKHSPEQALKNYSEALRYSDASWKKRAECLTNRGKLLFEMHPRQFFLRLRFHEVKALPLFFSNIPYISDPIFLKDITDYGE